LASGQVQLRAQILRLPDRRVRSHRAICRAGLDPFGDSQDMLRSEIEQPAEPSSPTFAFADAVTASIQIYLWPQNCFSSEEGGLIARPIREKAEMNGAHPRSG